MTRNLPRCCFSGGVKVVSGHQPIRPCELFCDHQALVWRHWQWRGRPARARLDLSPGRGPAQLLFGSFLPCLLHLRPLSQLSQNHTFSCNCAGLDDESLVRFGITNAKICHTGQHCVPRTRSPEE